MMVKVVSLAIALLTIAQCCSAKNILFLGYPAYSHLFGLANVGKFLQTQGHNVLLASPPQLKDKLEEHGVDLLLYHSLGDFSEERLIRNNLLQDYFATSSVLQDLQAVLHGNKVTQLVTSALTKILKDDQLFKDIEDFKPDLIVMDSSSIAIMLPLIPYKLNVPFIMMGSEDPPQRTRAPIVPTVDPQNAFPYTDQMNFLQRVGNTITHLLAYRLSIYIDSPTITEYIAEKPYISPIDLQAKAQLWIIRQHGVLSYNPPTMPNVKRVGHLQTLTPKALPSEFQAFVENADNGVIIVAFGSVLASTPTHVIDKLLAAFEQTKYKFIIQGSVKHRNQSDKFMFRKWLPQFDLLSHQKTKLFITHCGSNGLQEALIAGVPIIGFPVFADQPHNAGKIVRKGFGLKLDLKSFSVQELVSAIKEVTMNPSYKAKVGKASSILKSERVPPIEEAAFWINHVLTFGGEHLRSYAQDIPLWKYLGLDIIAFFLLIWHVFVFLLIILLKNCFVRCCGRKQKLKHQ